jgi:hypothetical protein
VCAGWANAGVPTRVEHVEPLLLLEFWRVLSLIQACSCLGQCKKTSSPLYKLSILCWGHRIWPNSSKDMELSSLVCLSARAQGKSSVLSCLGLASQCHLQICGRGISLARFLLMGALGFELWIKVNALGFELEAEIQKSEFQIFLEASQLNGLIGVFNKLFWLNFYNLYCSLVSVFQFL